MLIKPEFDSANPFTLLLDPQMYFLFWMLAMSFAGVIVSAIVAISV